MIRSISIISVITICGGVVFAQSEGSAAENIKAKAVLGGDVSVSSNGLAVPVVASSRMTASSFRGTSQASHGDSSLAEIQPVKENHQKFMNLLALKQPITPIDARPQTIFPPGIRATIFPPDTRTRVDPTTNYPARATVLLTSSAGRCSGWMIGADTVATAGHCVHGGRGGSFFTNVVAYPGRNGPSSPYGSCTARTLYSVNGWMQNSDYRYDYGAVKLNCTIGNTTGWYGMFWTTSSLIGLPTIINGYPGDKPLEQWQSTGKVTATDQFSVLYGNDMINGDSGAPIYYNRSSTCNPCAMAINANNEGTGFFQGSNRGTRIRQEVFNNLIAWRNAP